MADNLIYDQQIRLQAYHNAPLRGGEEYQFGFYDAGILRHALESLGGNVKYEVKTLPIPRDDSEFNHAIALLNDPELQYALVDKNKIVYTYIYGLEDDDRGWLKVMNKLGYQVHSGPKTNKRIKSFHRPTLLNARFDHLNIVYVEPHEYSKYDFTNSTPGEIVANKYCDPEVIERLLDGGFVVSKRLIQHAVINLPIYEEGETSDPNDYYFDPRIRLQLVRDLLNTPVFNGRIIFEDGFLKGNMFVAELPDDIDIITARGNVKPEITYHNGFQLQAEPQGPKTRVITDDQTVVNLPQLFNPQDMELWLEHEYEKMFNDATNNRLLTNWRYIYQRMWRDKDDINDNEARARMAYVGYRWVAAGFQITHSPWLFETISISHAKPLESKIPIPCSVYEQVVPESLIRMAGYEIEVEEGTIVRHNELGVHVVDDLDWLEMYESHGGHDQDDFFKLFYRTIEGGDFDGEKMVIVIRSPNGYGEYTMFKYVEGEWSPTWHLADGTPIKFPTVDGTNWPTRLSSAIYSNEISYTGLPSTKLPKQTRSGPYTKDDVIRDIQIAMSGGNVGGYVNACMLHASTIGAHRTVQLCSLEDAIDKCINPDSKQDVAAIDNEAKMMMREVVTSQNPVDRILWTNRGSRRYLKPGEEVTLYNGIITQMYTLCSKYNKDYIARIKEWSQTNARPPQIIHDLGKRMHYWAMPHLNKFRTSVYAVNSSEQTSMSGHIQRSSWESLYQSIVDEINTYERTQDKYDFVLGLYSSAINKPTTGGKVTDQIVMNRFVYPYLEAALQYYGVAAISMYDNRHGRVKIRTIRNDEWYWPDINGEMHKYDNPLDFQTAHAQDSPIDFRMPAPTTGPILVSIV